MNGFVSLDLDNVLLLCEQKSFERRGVGALVLCGELHFTGSQQALQWYWPDESFASEGFLFQGTGSNETNLVRDGIVFTVIVRRRTKTASMAYST